MDTKIGGTSSESLDYKSSIKSIIERLNDVEINGYSPLEITKTDGSDEQYENDSRGIHAKSNTNEQSEVDESQNSKKKKKKKKKGQTGNDDGVDELSVTPSVSSVAKREADIDLVSMLLAMGFMEEQINAAVDACGGTDRATADDLVEWILSGGASTDSNSGDNTIDESSQSARNGINSSEPYTSQMAMSDTKQKRILTQAEREAEEAAKREAEAKAAAERLAAKREEQRRIRLEWNNREQLRQQEEAKAKLAEEVERKRRIEIEKAKIAAQRAAKERAAAGATMMYQDSNSAIASMSEGLQMQNNPNVGSTPLFPGMTFQGDHNLSSENQYYPHTQSPHVGFNQSMMPQAGTLSYPEVATTFRSSPVPSSDLSSHDYSGSRSKTKKTSPVNIDVHGNEFPVLGANKSSSPNRRNKSKKGSPNSGDNKKVGKAKTRKKKEPHIKDSRSMEFVPPHVNNMFSEQVVSDQPSYMQRPYESNPLGEIRATAKAFVPTHFKPTTSMPPGFNNAPKPQQPDFVAPSTSNPLILSNMAPGSSLLSTNPSPIPSLNAATTTMLKESSAPFDTSAISVSGPTKIGIPFDQSNHSNQKSFASPSPMTLSFGSSQEMVGSTGLGGLPSSSLVGSSLGMLDSNAPAPSLSGSSIWGAAPATSSSNIPNSSGLGMFSFNFVNNNVVSNTRDDENNKGNPSNLWGAGGVSSINGGGSIW